ncbi:MAG: hypothetical protein U0931_36025 [Vulcanimicrobiota bacterium]
MRQERGITQMCYIRNGHGFDWASQNFNRRIGAGVTDGSLKGYEIGMVGQANRHYQQDLARAKADGVINPWERASLASERCAVSHEIYELRHNSFGNLPGGPRPAVDPFPTPWPNVLTQPAIDPKLPTFPTQPAVDPFLPCGVR